MMDYLHKVRDELEFRMPGCTIWVEYPGVLVVSYDEDHRDDRWVFGNSNETWQGDLYYGEDLSESLHTVDTGVLTKPLNFPPFSLASMIRSTLDYYYKHERLPLESELDEVRL